MVFQYCSIGSWFYLGLVLVFVFLARKQRYQWLYILSKTYKRDLKLGWYFGQLGFYIWYWEKANKTVPAIFSSIARKNPQKVAFFFEDQVWTFAQLDEFSNQIARYFKSQGYKKGDCIALLLENRPEYVGIWLGLSKIGVTTALINTNLVSAPLIHSISVAKSKGLIFGSNHAEAIKNIKGSLNTLKFYQFHEQTKEDKEALPECFNLRKEIDSISSDPVKIDGQTARDPLLYIYTSGTTGLPKAALLTNIRYLYISTAVYLCGALTPNDVVYNPLPLYHAAGGMIGAGMTLVRGTTLTIRKKFSASNYWKDCAKYRCTYGQYIGEMCRYILAASNGATPVKHKLKGMFGNGLRPQIWKQFTESFDVNQIFEFYGATEGISNMVNVSNVVGCIGSVPRYARWIYPVTLIKCDETTGDPIRDSNGRCIECKVNEPGLIIGKINPKKALYSFKGYSDKQASEKKILNNVFVDGDFYFNSGDILVADELGDFFFKDRTGDTFRWKGENVSTAEVEGVISNIVQLNDAAVYGVEIPETEGKAGMAAIVDTNKALDVELLCNGLKGNLPTYAIPVFLRVMESIQLTGTYKLKKVELQGEGFNINKIKDKVYFYNSKIKQYEILTKEKYEQIMAGKMSL